MSFLFNSHSLYCRMFSPANKHKTGFDPRWQCTVSQLAKADTKIQLFHVLQMWLHLKLFFLLAVFLWLLYKFHVCDLIKIMQDLSTTGYHSNAALIQQPSIAALTAQFSGTALTRQLYWLCNTIYYYNRFYLDQPRRLLYSYTILYR